MLKTAYLGGLPGLPPLTTRARGTLTFGPDYIIWHRSLSGRTKFAINWEDVRGVSFETGTLEKSRLGRALLIGWPLALTTRATRRDTHLIACLKDGNAAVFRVEGMASPALRAQVQPYLSTHEVPCLDDGAPPADPTPTFSKADELSKLAQLRDSGVLTDEEFDAEKARLLGG